MALDKSSLPINFALGLDTKTDPFQVSPGKMLSLKNTVFSKGGLLQKRNGNKALAPLPMPAAYTTTYNGSLLAIGRSIQAYNESNNVWQGKGTIDPVDVAVRQMVRSATNQSQADAATAPNGLVCTVFTDNIPSGSSTVPVYKYQITTQLGDLVQPPTPIPPGSGAIVGSPRVFVVGIYFIIVFSNLISGTNHLQYIPISTSAPTQVMTTGNFSSQYTPASTVAFDGVVTNNSLYIAWHGSDGAIRATYLDRNLNLHNTVVYAARIGTLFTVCADETQSSTVIYVSFYDSGSQNGYTLAFNTSLVTVLAPTQIITGLTVLNLASVAQDGVCTVYEEISNDYSYDSSIATNLIRSLTITQAGSVTQLGVLVRSLGLGSKAFLMDGQSYFMGAYQSTFQPSYFLMNGDGDIVSRIAYENGGGYLVAGLPSAQVLDDTVQIAYLYKDLIEAVNKSQGAPNAAGVYSQTGVNLSLFTFIETELNSAEIGGNLNLNGGFLRNYDGAAPVENNFFIFPEDLEATPTTSAGGMAFQDYFYVATYEWTDANGNINRSAPSVPLEVDMSGLSGTPITFTSVFAKGAKSITVSSATGLVLGQTLTDSTTGANIAAGTYITSIVGTTIGLSLPTEAASASTPGDTLSTADVGKVTINVPTLRLTYKTTVKIVLYRWSAAQETYYQVTSVLVPLLNDKTADSVQFVDKLGDGAILGNNILYTTGGVFENLAPPPSAGVALFKSRLFSINAEDRNVLDFSKQVIENTPVEMNDNFSIYVAPTVASEGSTGEMKCVAPLDDKLVIFKANAIYYISGTGPNNLGADNDFSDPVFITSVVGCSNKNSIVFTPNGLMFQSNKGIWLLDRSTGTSYIGAAVEEFNDSKVLSAINIPNTNYVLFTLDSGVTLMYDYYFEQWGTFVNIPAVSSTLYQDLHTYINSRGQVFQETPGKYLDGSQPVLMSFTTAWLSLAGIQGFERAYFFYLLATYLSPHKLNVQIAYDYVSTIQQSTIISPDNFTGVYGSAPLFGSGSPYGGPSQLEQWRIFLKRQKCRTFQITINEIFDSTKGVVAGAGFTMSGINLIIGGKGNYPRLRASRQAG